MPNSINKFSNNIQCLEKIPLENGWEQWLVKSDKPLKINPSSNLILESFPLPVLWQIDDYQLICINSGKHVFKQKKRWENYSIINPKIEIIENHNDPDYCLMVCPRNTLFFAIHQIQHWRQTRQLTKQLIVIAEAHSNAAFKLQPSIIYSSLVPSSVTASIALLEDWGVLCRFANTDWQPGCYQGELIELKNIILKRIYPSHLKM